MTATVKTPAGATFKAQITHRAADLLLVAYPDGEVQLFRALRPWKSVTGPAAELVLGGVR